MDKTAMSNFISGIENKLGKETASIISDDLGILITDNEKMIQKETDLTNQITELKDKNSKLVDANSSLLQQVGQIKPEEVDIPKEPIVPEVKEKISLQDCFENGKFVR